MPDSVVADLGTLPGVEVRETHLSRVYLSGDRAYKQRKSLRFPFVDQSTAAARQTLAQEEVRLNQELAPDTYLGVRAMTGPDGAQDAVVEMRRFDETDTLARRLVDDRVEEGSLQVLGARLAAFHANCPPLPEGGVRAALTRVHRNTEELAEQLGPLLSAEQLWGLTRPLEAFALRHARQFEERAQGGAWREGHGDLRADHVVFDRQGLRIVDRLEFDRGLRVDDVACDLAFLLMDLEWRGAGWAAEQVLAAYRLAGGDPGDDALLAFWAAYRAGVSTKVALLRAGQRGAPQDDQRVRTLIALAGHLAWRTREPRVIVFCGPPASGKSTLAQTLEQRAGLPVVSSDLVRKAIHGVAPTTSAPATVYTAQASLEVYEELGLRALSTLETGGRVVVDATMGGTAQRAAFTAALGGAGPVVFVECRVPAAEADRRAQARLTDRAAVSDATPAIAARLRAAWEPLDEVTAAGHLALRADREPGAAIDELERRLDAIGGR